MQLKDLQKGDRFRLPNDEREYCKPREVSEETTACAWKDSDDNEWLCYFPSDWECEKVEEVNPIHNPLNRLVRHIIDHWDLYEERYSNGENIAPTILNSFPDLFKDLFTRSDMVEFTRHFSFLSVHHPKGVEGELEKWELEFKSRKK